MTDMVTRVADAIGTQLLLEGGGYGYAERLTDDEGGQSTDMVVDATVSLTALARAAIEAIPGWQPIETAPKDGTKFLAANGRDIETTAWQYLNLIMHHDGKDEMVYGFVAKYSQWWPTHWMTSPAPPVAALREPNEEEKRSAE